MICKIKYCSKYKCKACCFFCKDKKVCEDACLNDASGCGRLQGDEDVEEKISGNIKGGKRDGV